VAGGVATFHNYTRTLEARYPQAVKEIYAATKGVAAHGEEIGVDGKTLAVGRKLDAAGVKVTTVRYDGMSHDFGLLNGLAAEPAVRSLFAHAAAELQHYLH